MNDDQGTTEEAGKDPGERGGQPRKAAGDHRPDQQKGRRAGMIAAWWLSVAFVIGVAFGMFLTALMAAGGDKHDQS